MKVFSVYLVLLWQASISCCAQSNFQEGYVVTVQNDTLRGFIDQRDWLKNPRSISFKSKTSDINQHFSTKEIQYFEIFGSVSYATYISSISMNEIELSRLDLPEAQSKSDTVFLKVLQSGKHLSLFSYQDKLKKRFYIMGKAGVPEELIFKRRRIDQSVKNFDIYKNQLTSAALDAGKLDDHLKHLISSSGYNERNIVKVVNEINENKTIVNLIKDAKKVSGSGYFLGVDLVSGTLAYNGYTDLAQGQTHNPLLTLPFFIAGYDAWLNPHVGTMVLRTELMAGISKYNPSSSQTTSSYVYKAEQNVTQPMVCLSGMLMYNYLKIDKVRAFIAGGIRLSFSSVTQNTYTTQEIHSTVTINEQRNNFPALDQTFWFSFPIKTGVIIKQKYEISVSYVPNATLTTYTAFAGKVNYFQFGVKYHF